MDLLSILTPCAQVMIGTTVCGAVSGLVRAVRHVTDPKTYPAPCTTPVFLEPGLFVATIASGAVLGALWLPLIVASAVAYPPWLVVKVTRAMWIAGAPRAVPTAPKENAD
jgi:hypothetical protein